MATPRAIAYNVLNAGDNADKGVVAFMDALLEIEEELVNIESEVADLIIDVTGYQAQSDLTEFESEYVRIAHKISTAKKAIFSHRLHDLERYNSDFHTNRTRNALIDYIQKFIEKINELEQMSGRISNRIQSKRNSANSRLIATISGAAVAISTITLLLSAAGIV